MEGIVTILLILTGINTLELLYRFFTNKNASDIVKYPYMSLNGTEFERWVNGKIDQKVRELEQVFEYPALYFDDTNLSQYIQDGTDAKIEELAEATGYERSYPNLETWKKVK